MDTKAAVTHWMEAYAKAWRARDPGAVVALFTDDAIYSSHPFRVPYRGRSGVLEYSKKAFGEDELQELRWGQPMVEGPKAAVEYWATMRENGEEVTLAGFNLLRFAPDGRCIELREYWAMDEGSRSPPPGWGK